jgi:hypothetical protein
LARILEYSKENALNLASISSKDFYSRGINVFGFDKVNKSVLRVAGLGSCGDRLLIDGNNWDGFDSGYAFGVLNSDAEGVALKNK